MRFATMLAPSRRFEKCGGVVLGLYVLRYVGDSLYTSFFFAGAGPGGGVGDNAQLFMALACGL